MATISGIQGRRGLRLVGATAAVVLGAYALTYLAYAAYLFAFADEGAVPPGWRVPEVPSGAQVVSDTRECGSGGCWRQLVIRPGSSQTADDLATEMGLGSSERSGWRWYDPHSVEVSVSVAGDDLRVAVGY